MKLHAQRQPTVNQEKNQRERKREREGKKRKEKGEREGENQKESALQHSEVSQITVREWYCMGPRVGPIHGV